MSCLVHRIDDGKDTTDETLQILNNIGSQNTSVHTYPARAPKGESQCHLQMLSFHKVSSTRSKRKRSSTKLPSARPPPPKHVVRALGAGPLTDPRSARKCLLPSPVRSECDRTGPCGEEA